MAWMVPKTPVSSSSGQKLLPLPQDKAWMKNTVGPDYQHYWGLYLQKSRGTTDTLGCECACQLLEAEYLISLHIFMVCYFQNQKVVLWRVYILALSWNQVWLLQAGSLGWSLGAPVEAFQGCLLGIQATSEHRTSFPSYMSQYNN